MVSQKAVELIKRHEGLKLTPYLCPSRIPTIGYGFTMYRDGSYVTMDDPPMSIDDAERTLLGKVEKYYNQVKKLAPSDLTENQLAALTSFVYNVGVNAFKNSSLLKLIKQDPGHSRVRYEFSRWNKSRGIALAGLIKRRKEEADLYFSA